ncbi:MAG: hypothetical protein AAB259_03045 [Pseudomonadota bacterium]
MRTGIPQIHLNRLLPQLRWQIGRLGAAGKIGLGLLVATSIYFFSVVLPQETVLRKLKERAETLQTQVSSKQTSGDAETSKKMSGDQALQAFYDFFPRIDS